MNNRKLKNKTAFSLIELSIVILIVGIIVAGVTQSSRLISAFKLNTARNLTQSSPVASMKNLTLWFDTTSAASFKDTQADNALTIDTWYDINPTSTYKYNATQVTAGNQPTYTTNCMNSLPCLRFGGVTDDDTMGYDGTFLVASEYTIIVVEQRRDSKTINYFLAGGNNGTNVNLHLGYRTDTALTIGQYANDYNITVAAYSVPTPRIHVFRFSTTTGKSHFLNGATSTLIDTGGASGTTGLTAYVGATIGYYAPNGSFFDGDICEIIMFTRAITTEERDAIEVYLGKKWNITVS